MFNIFKENFKRLLEECQTINHQSWPESLEKESIEVLHIKNVKIKIRNSGVDKAQLKRQSWWIGGNITNSEKDDKEDEIIKEILRDMEDTEVKLQHIFKWSSRRR